MHFSSCDYLSTLLFIKNQMLNVENKFPALHTVLKKDQKLGIFLKFGSRSVEMQPYNILKDYYVDSSTDHIIEHNLNWARGNVLKPIFQFAYLMLPTICNQRCNGCFMGKDKGYLPNSLQGSFFTHVELVNILSFLKEHGARAIVYGGGGELFTWEGAFEFINTISEFGLRPIIFTNGTLLTKSNLTYLNSLNTTLIISIRDTSEMYHNAVVGSQNFLNTLSTIDNALLEGFHKDGRLAVEIPVTCDNEERIIQDFLPAMRYLGIVPMVEEYIQLFTSDSEKECCHNFSQSRRFFEKMSQKDLELGISWKPEFGQRMIAQPQCQRPLYSFAIFPSREVMDCPSHSVCYGNLHIKPLKDIIYSSAFKQAILDFYSCACSVFYTNKLDEIPQNLPNYLDVLR
jgi:MoaA/NifB/PqqE/SkfB family radical SAM enzyme